MNSNENDGIIPIFANDTDAIKHWRDRVMTLEREKSELENRNCFLEELLARNLQKQDPPLAAESSDDESAEEEDDDLLPLRRTLESENVLTNFGPKEKVEVPGEMIEDSLFDRTSVSKTEFLQLLLRHPLNSYLLVMDTDMYKTNINHITERLVAAEHQIKGFVNERDQLRDIQIPGAITALTFFHNKKVELERNLKSVENELASCENHSINKEEELESFQRRKEVLISNIERITKTVQVATLLKDTMKEIISFHETPALRQNLPLATVSSESDPTLVSFKSYFGFSDYASTDVSQRKLIQIARVSKILGIEYSSWYTTNQLPALVVGKKWSTARLRNQICKMFGIPLQVDEGEEENAGIGSGRFKRKTSDSLPPAKKRAKTDDASEAMEHFVSTKEGRTVVLQHPHLRKAVMASPKLQRAFLSPIPGKQADPRESDNSNGQS